MTAPDPSRCTPLFLERIPRAFALEHGVLSQGCDDGDVEIVATQQMTTPQVLHNIGTALGRRVAARESEAAALTTAIEQAYQFGQDEDERTEATTHAIPAIDAGQDDESLAQLLDRADRDLLRSHGKAPVVRLVDRLIFVAARDGASDLHIQPLADRVVIRQRVDGVLDTGHDVPRHVLQAMVSRIKVMGRMDVAERLVPQDGRCSVHIGARTIDLRISSIPTAHGERIVIRLLDTTQQRCEFELLGMPGAVADHFLDHARRSSGIVLVTGPTGSGKTTTLYATLRELDSRERNIMTIEDPIEYELDSLGLPISQSQVNEKKGVNFANGLRHILRQDPDIIMVGEIRDAETARVAIQSSLTGHLVFSTMHTNDAPSAATRLIDLGVEPYLVAASLSCVLAQRLVRRSCIGCAGAGCPQCGGSGFKGRIGVFELMPIDESLRAAISERSSLSELRRRAEAAGMRSLHEAGRDLVEAGLTTAVELERVIHG